MKHLTVCKVYIIVNHLLISLYIYIHIYKELKEILTINLMWTVALGIWQWYQIKIWILLVQIKFCLCISFLEKEMNSAAPFALKKMLMLPRLNLCWRYYKRLQFLPPKHSLPYAIGTFFLRTETFFSASPFFTCRTPAVPACPATLS